MQTCMHREIRLKQPVEEFSREENFEFSLMTKRAQPPAHTNEPGRTEINNTSCTEE